MHTTASRRVKSVHQSLWTRAEVLQLGNWGNFKTNAVFERHIPQAWRGACQGGGGTADERRKRRRRRRKGRGSGDEEVRRGARRGLFNHGDINTY